MISASDTGFPPAPATRSVSLATLLLLLAMRVLSTSATSQAQVLPPEDETEFVGYFDRQNLPVNKFTVPPYPCGDSDNPMQCGQELPVEETEELDGGEMYMFGNEAGRVRAMAVTGGVEPDHGRVTLYWARSFRKETPTDRQTFTVNPSWAEISNARFPTAFSSDPPEAEFYIAVDFQDAAVYPEGQPYFPTPQTQFRHWARIQGFTGEPSLGPSGLVLEDRYMLTEEGVSEIFRSATNTSDRVTTAEAGTFLEKQDGWRYDIEKYVQDIDLSAVPVGGLYTIRYTLWVNVKNVGSESIAEAFVGDPLDPNSGITLETSGSTPVGGAVAFCDRLPDPQRYVDNQDGTVDDTHTGLTWGRCPLGFTLDDAGTAADLGDDQCLLDDRSTHTWQQALQGATTDTTAGHDDWRLPNLKELESVIELGCRFPSVNDQVFPDIVDRYWSSTPDPSDGAAAQALDADSGATIANEKTESLFALLVRESASPPSPPRPAVTLARPAPVAESEDGSSNAMTFRVLLSRPPVLPVTIGYETNDDSAVAGEDYVATSGELTMQPGESEALIEVPILADDVAEPDEAFLLRLTSASPEVYLRLPIQSGRILDAQPVITVDAADVHEGDAGTTMMEFPVRLSRAATTEVAFEYSAQDDTATGGVDFVPHSGTTVIPAGGNTAMISITVNGDADVEGDERLRLVLSEPAGGVARHAIAEVYGYIIDDDRGFMNALNDTGVIWCASQFSSFSSCPQPDYPGQDAEFGWDVLFPDDSDGFAGASFTKLDAAGVPLADQVAAYGVTPWDCVRDEITGLMWETKTTTGDLRDRDSLLTWYNSTGRNDGGDAGTEDGGSCPVTGACDTENYAAAVNAAGICGFHDWRLPTREELHSIVLNQAGINLSLDPNYFPNFHSSGNLYTFWTATPVADSPESAWSMQLLGSSSMSRTSKDLALQVILVRKAE